MSFASYVYLTIFLQWYAKKVSIGAAVGYFAGIATYLLENAILGGGGFMDNILPPALAFVENAQTVSGIF